MKYSKNNPPLVCMMTQSTCYKGTRKMTPKGVLWHSTGANNPTIKRYVQPDDDAPNRTELISLIGKNTYGNDWNHIERKAGLNAWIGKLADGTIATVQTMPWNFRPWGCGSGSKGSCNDYWIQFEICEDNLKNKDYFEAVYKEACELTAYCCEMYDIDPMGTVDYKGIKVPTILDHATSYKLKLGGNHGDVQHWFKKYGKTLDDVRKDVAALIGKQVVETPKYDASKIDTSAANPKVVWDHLKAAGLNDYGIAGLMGNLLAESALKPTNLQNTFEKKLGMSDAEYTAAVDAKAYSNFIKDGAGYGLAQWTYWSRKKAMLEFHQKAGKSIGDLETQLDFLIKELSKNYKSVWNTLKTGKSIKETSNAVLLKYERPANTGESVQAKRAEYSQSYYDKFASKEEEKVENKPASSGTQLKQDDITVGAIVRILNGATYYTGKVIPIWVKNKEWVVESVSGDRVVINKSKDGKNAIKSPINIKYLELVGEQPESTSKEENNESQESAEKFVRYLVKINVDKLNYRAGPGTNYKVNGTVKRNGVYTIVEEKDGWGKLKSGAGWIYLAHVERFKNLEI